MSKSKYVKVRLPNGEIKDYKVCKTCEIPKDPEKDYYPKYTKTTGQPGDCKPCYVSKSIIYEKEKLAKDPEFRKRRNKTKNKSRNKNHNTKEYDKLHKRAVTAAQIRLRKRHPKVFFELLEEHKKTRKAMDAMIKLKSLRGEYYTLLDEEKKERGLGQRSMHRSRMNELAEIGKGLK